MILFLKLILWPAVMLFTTAVITCIHLLLTVRLTQVQQDRCFSRLLLWIALLVVSTAGLIALHFS